MRRRSVGSALLWRQTQSYKVGMDRPSHSFVRRKLFHGKAISTASFVPRTDVFVYNYSNKFA